MGPVRRGLILACLPGPLWAEVCDKERPNWDGGEVTALSEALTLFSLPASLIMLVLTALAVRFRSPWGGLAVVVLWTTLVSVVTTWDLSGLRADAILEGCVGSPALFIGAVTAICIATILYTAPLPKRS